MNKTYFCIILLICFSSFLNKIFSQELTLNFTSKDSIENKILSKVDYNKIHSNKKKLLKENNRIIEKLKLNGYFTITNDSLTNLDNNYISYISLNKKINSAFINFNNNTTNLAIEKLSEYLNSISNSLDKKGKSFSKIQLKNLKISDNNLYATIKINESKKRIINKVIIKGYENFSKSYIRHFLKLKKTSLINKQKLSEISKSIKNLDFVTETKPPEVLFTKDSTIVYLYLKKKSNNSFDGLINFSSNSQGNGISFNGHLDLKLNNILHTGESFQLNWNANGNERQDFNLKTEIPYIFNSPITPTLNFSIFKQDSTFLNSELKTSLKYDFNNRFSTSLLYESTNSTNSLENNSFNNIKNFNSIFVGLGLNYKVRSDNFINENRILFNTLLYTGNRNNENQFKIEFEASYLVKINDRNFIYLRNHSGYLKSDSYLQNELFRLGGTDSFRGVLPKSIFSHKFSYINTEYRLKTSKNNYLYSVLDYGVFEKHKNTVAFGIGYNFKINNNNISFNSIYNEQFFLNIRITNFY